MIHVCNMSTELLGILAPMLHRSRQYITTNVWFAELLNWFHHFLCAQMRKPTMLQGIPSQPWRSTSLSRTSELNLSWRALRRRLTTLLRRLLSLPMQAHTLHGANYWRMCLLTPKALVLALMESIDVRIPSSHKARLKFEPSWKIDLLSVPLVLRFSSFVEPISC